MPINPHPLKASERFSVVHVTADDTERRKPGYYVFDKKKQRLVQEAFGLKDAEEIVARKNG
jgi:hypothetical protein